MEITKTVYKKKVQGKPSQGKQKGHMCGTFTERSGKMFLLSQELNKMGSILYLFHN